MSFQGGAKVSARGVPDLSGLVARGEITEAEADDPVATGTVPAALLAVIEALPANRHFAARAAGWCRSCRVRLRHQLRPARAVIGLQRAVGVADDGKMGPLTLAAVITADPAAVIRTLCAERLTFLRQLSTWPPYKNGWTTRVKRVEQEALAMAASAPGSVPPPPDIVPSRATSTQPTSSGLFASRARFERTDRMNPLLVPIVGSLANTVLETLIASSKATVTVAEAPAIREETADPRPRPHEHPRRRHDPLRPLEGQDAARRVRVAKPLPLEQ